jgi:hypothetical protein
MLSQFSFRRVVNQREADPTRNALVDVRQLRWKRFPKFTFFGFMVASLTAGNSSSRSIGEQEAKHQ